MQGSSHPVSDLQALNTLALPAQVACYRKILSPDELPRLDLPAGPRFILGGGSNLVLTGDIDGCVLHMGIRGRKWIAEDAEAWYVQAGAGESWHDFVQWTLANHWPGLENLSLIPGTVGAAPIQNIGAYGAEVADFLHGLMAWDFGARRWRAFSRADCAFSYRHSVFKQEGWHLSGEMAITHVTFRLPKQWQANTGYADVLQALASRNCTTPDARAIAEAVIAVRQQKLPDPAELPNAGSFFQNPVLPAMQVEALRREFSGLPCYPQPDGRIKVAAGWLIEQAGWKGRQLGPAGMYARQALVLVNHGGAKGEDVLRLMRAVQADVMARFSIRLEPEPIFWPVMG